MDLKRNMLWVKVLNGLSLRFPHFLLLSLSPFAWLGCSEFSSLSKEKENVEQTLSRPQSFQSQSGTTQCLVTTSDCPNHPRFSYRRNWSNSFRGADKDETKCLARSRSIYTWCGASQEVSSVFVSYDEVVSASFYSKQNGEVIVRSKDLPSKRPLKRVTGTVKVRKHGEIIENLEIHTSNTAGIEIRGYKNVIIRNVVIRHRQQPGIEFNNAPNLKIENVQIVNHSKLTDGRSPPRAISIFGTNSTGIQIYNTRLVRGAHLLVIRDSSNIRVDGLDGRDIKGPGRWNSTLNYLAPHGQCVSLQRVNNANIKNFSCLNEKGKSIVSDIINIFYSRDVHLEKGLLKYTEHHSGAGIQFENSRDGSVTDVDVLEVSHTAFAAYPGYNIDFLRARTRDIPCDSSSPDRQTAGLAFTFRLTPLNGEPPTSGITIRDSSWYNRSVDCPSRSSLIHSAKVVNGSPVLIEEDFQPRSPYRAKFDW